MKYLTIIFLLLSISAFAQHPDTLIIQKDTINLQGIIYDAAGKPAQRVLLTSQQKDIAHDQYKIITSTDTMGRFQINGAKFNDTILVQNGLQKYTYLNNGSRFMIIHLPLSPVTDINSSKPIKISAVRKHPKVKPIFKVTKLTGVMFFQAIDIQPEFPGGVEKFKTFIKSHLTYPEQAIQSNIEGTVQIGFTIDRDGTLKDFEILNGIGYGCDELIINILKTSPHWKPGIAYGRAVTCRETISVQFSLTDK